MSNVGLRIALLFVIVIPALYASSCTYTSSRRNKAFDSVGVGDTKEAVIQKMGSPSVREVPGALFSRYASQQCQERCAERLWYENRLSLDTEAWSFELDKIGQVVEKTRWVSP